MESRIIYFEKAGKENTETVMKIVKKRAAELNIRTIVAASAHGYTAEKAINILGDLKIILVGGFYNPTMENLSKSFTPEYEKMIKGKATLLVTTHLFAGIAAASKKRWNTTETSEIVATTLRMFGAGIKVGIECTVMASDAGLIRTNEDIIAIGETQGGADSAIVLKPVTSQNLYDIKVKEILCKPINW